MDEQPPSNDKGISGTCKRTSANFSNAGDMVDKLALPVVQRDICWSGRGGSWRVILPLLYSDRTN